MVADHFQGAGETVEQAHTVVVGQHGLAVHGFGGVVSAATPRLGEGLVPEAYAQHGDVGKLNDVEGVADVYRVVCSTGAGGKDHCIKVGDEFNAEFFVMVDHCGALANQVL